MKLKLFFIINVLMVAGVNLYCQEKSAEDIQIILNTDQQTWYKGADLNLSGKIVNNSKSKITLIRPRSSNSFFPNLYTIVLPSDFEKNDCNYQSPDDTYASKYDFMTIESGKEMYFNIKGTNYPETYCPKRETSKDSIEVSILYKGKKQEYTKDSPNIKYDYPNLKGAELDEIVEYYNSLYPYYIKSNTVKIKIEK